MSFCANYTLEVYDNPNNISVFDIIKFMYQQLEKDEDTFYPFSYELDRMYHKYKNNPNELHEFETGYSEEICWMNDGMELLAKQFPTVIFKLHCEGEDNTCYDEYYRGENSVRYDAKIPPLNMADLEDIEV